MKGSPFDRFNAPSRKVLSDAQNEALRLGHAAIRPQHLLLALLQNPGSVTAEVFRRIGVDAAALRAEVTAKLGREQRAGGPEPAQEAALPFSAESRRVFLAILAEAVGLGHRYVGSEHVLLGLLREGGERVSGALAARGLGLELARATIRAALGEDGVLPEPKT